MIYPNLMMNEIKIASNFIKTQLHTDKYQPKICVILGSGLGKFSEKVEIIANLKYSDIPFFPVSHVIGHKGSLSIGKIDNKFTLIMEGRFHFYEGYSPKELTFPIGVFNQLGINKLIVSNASGGINKSFVVGDLMIINDHINFTGNHPLIGKNDELYGGRFLDQTEPYCKQLIQIAKDTALLHNIMPKEGVYIGVSGPTFETKAEINAFRTLGADAVGMSTIFEVIMANYFKMKVLGISSITNMATGVAEKSHEHQDVVSVANLISDKFSNWVIDIIKKVN
jgi:purine-nucleoside phosphorylase